MERAELAKSHAKNKSQIRLALKQQKLILNTSIKSKNDLQERLSIRIYIILYLALLETSLNHLIYYYHKQINEYELNEILNELSQEKRWAKLIEICYRNNFLQRKKTKEINLINLGHSNYNRYLYLKNILESEIVSFIGLRNKLAHGQWAIALNNEGTDKTQEITTKLWTLSKKDCLHIKNIIENFLKIVEKLIASKENFVRDYDDLVYKIEYTKKIQSNSYDWIISEMKRKYLAFDRSVKKK